MSLHSARRGIARRGPKVTNEQELAGAWQDEYARLARAVARSMRPTPSEIVEVGGGDGAFTVPLALSLPVARLVVIDRYDAPYTSSHQRLVRALRRRDLLGRVRVVIGDARVDMRRLDLGRRSRAVVSCEFLSELTSAEMTGFFEACSRVLAVGGVTTHLFLAPVPRNASQRLTIDADTDPRWTRHPPREWFSPTPELVAASLTQCGFRRVRLQTLRSRIRMVGRAAQAQLRRWGVRETFAREHRRLLNGEGLELPDWMMLSATR